MKDAKFLGKLYNSKLLKFDSRNCLYATLITYNVCSIFLGRLYQHDQKRVSEVSKRVGATV